MARSKYALLAASQCCRAAEQQPPVRSAWEATCTSLDSLIPNAKMVAAQGTTLCSSCPNWHGCVRGRCLYARACLALTIESRDRLGVVSLDSESPFPVTPLATVPEVSCRVWPAAAERSMLCLVGPPPCSPSV